MVAGLSTRNYRRAVESIGEGYGIEKEQLSRQFVAASSTQLRALCERRLEDLNLVVLMVDGIHFGGQVLVVDRSRPGPAAAVSGGHRWVESTARRGGTSFRGASGSAALPDSQAAECEGVSARELPERLRPAHAQRVCDEQLRRGQSRIGENLPAAGTD